ncbi:MAG: hypothetical protein AAF711_04010 [Planctomycetota bacterium]
MSTRIIQLGALVLTAVGVLVAFLLTPTINEIRVDRQLTFDVEVGDRSRPTYTLWAAAGSFRGVAINIAWQRAEALKQEGRFFESNLQAEWITSMQPRFPEAWDIQAWNMAYNISVKTKTAEERWDWVQKGMALLRDRGIPNNPNAVVLYRSIAWILGHKMAGQTDDMHWYYKARTAETWQTLLGLPNPGWLLKEEFREPPNRPLEEDLDPLVHGDWLATVQFKAIADMAENYLKKAGRTEDDYRPSNFFTTLSPENLKRFYEEHPGLQQVVRELESLQGPNGEELDLGLTQPGQPGRTLRAFGKIQLYQDAGYPVGGPNINTPETLGLDAMAVFAWLVQKSQDPGIRLNLIPGATQEQIDNFLKANPNTQFIDLVPLLDMLRALTLLDEYHMDPTYMLKTMETYGPIDWRHPAAHALYWSSLGTLRAEDWTQNNERVDLVNANRSIIHQLQKLAHQGKINFRPKVAGMGDFGKETIDHAPDVRMIPAYDIAWESTIKKIDAGEFGENKQSDTYKNGHENFLQAAVYLYYYDGQEGKARDYFARVKEIYNKPDNTSSPAYRDGHYALNLPDFARVRLDDDLGFQYEQLINERIRRAWTYGLAERSQAVMKRHLDAAKATYDSYLEDRQTTSRADLDVQARQGMRPFEDLVLMQFIEIMASTQYSMPQKSGVWQLAAPLLNAISDQRDLLNESYALMMPYLSSQAQLESQAFNVAEVFPQPRNYQQWYEENVQPQQPALPGLPQPSQTQ